MNHQRVTILIIIISTCLFGCNLGGKRGDQYEYIPLNQFHHTENRIQTGAELKLLAYAGGQKLDDKQVYYFQFLGLNTATGDTICILAPMIGIDESGHGGQKNYTTPTEFDPGKGEATAYYEAEDSTHNLLVQIDPELNMNGIDSVTDLKSLMDHISKAQFVVVNKSMPEFCCRRYPAAVGNLIFKERPW